MSGRKPPRLANWLLTRSGLDHQNPPLAGDLLEEFHSGRSRAWFWRQAFVWVLTCMAPKRRNSRRHFTGAVIGWSAQAGIALTLWSLHFPLGLQHGIGLPASFLVSIAYILALVLNKLAARELKRRSSDPERPLLSACEQFGNSLALYCVMTIAGVGRQGGFLVTQGFVLCNFILSDLILIPAFFAKLKKP
jgi:hypothetical protein